MVLQGVRLNHAPGETPRGLDRFAHPAASPEATLKTKFGMRKKGSAIPTLPIQAFCGVKRRKKRALVRMGEWCSARLRSRFDCRRIQSVCGCNVSQHG
jgi:hypothetical protein